MDSVYLIGSEDVRRAGYAMTEAAARMSQIAESLAFALQQHQRFMDEWLSRFQDAMKEHHG